MASTSLASSRAAPRALRLAGAALAIAAIATLPAAAVGDAGDASAPVRVVETLHEAMTAVLRRSGEIGYAQRFDLLAPALDRAYDLDFMARKSLGRSFERLSPAEQQRWLALFRTYTVASYAGRFQGYDGQRFETVGEEPSAQDTVLVRTKLIDPGTETVALDYRLRERDGAWKIVDVYLRGRVSELALRRSDFVATLDREGFAALVASLEAKVAELASGAVK